MSEKIIQTPRERIEADPRGLRRVSFLAGYAGGLSLHPDAGVRFYVDDPISIDPNAMAEDHPDLDTQEGRDEVLQRAVESEMTDGINLTPGVIKALKERSD